MIVKTKKFKLENGKYIKLALRNVIRQQWWVVLIALAIASGTFFIPETLWFIIGALIGLVGYLLFWVIQFAGVTQMEQFKILFDRLSYEINSQQVLIKISSKQGMPIGWDKIKRAYQGKDYFLLVLSKAQIIYLPFRVFNTTNEIKFVETILRRKEYIK